MRSRVRVRCSPLLKDCTAPRLERVWKTARVAQLQAHVGQVEALAERGVDLVVLDGLEGQADVVEHRVVGNLAASDGGGVGQARLRQRLEVAKAGLRFLVAQATFAGPL